MPAQPPDFSIIVACQEYGSGLEAVLASILSQEGVTVEAIVVARGVAPVILEPDARIVNAHLPNTGYFEAVNHGLSLARGTWAQFFVPDGRLVGNHLLGEVLNWSKRTEAAVLVGEVAYDDGRIRRMPHRVNPAAGNFAAVGAGFYRRALFEEHGPFDPRLGIQALYEFNTRLWKSHVRFKVLPLRVAAIPSGQPGDSWVWSDMREEIRVRHRYYPFYRCWLWDAASIARWARKKLLRSNPR